jgi:hypothetical protein
MRYRLGSFLARPGSSDFNHLLATGTGAQLTESLEEMLRVRLSAGLRKRVDLLQALDASHPDRPWVETIHARLIERSRSFKPRLLACDYEPGPKGFLTLAGSMPDLRVEVFEGDWMQIGFAAMREGQGTVRAWPRLLREVCRNGSLVCIAELDRHEGVEGIGDAIDRFLTPPYYEPAVERLRESRATAVADPREYLDEMQRTLHRQPPEPLDAMIRRFGGHAEGVSKPLDLVIRGFNGQTDRSLYGLFNAITATARDIDDWGDRLDLEEFAGRIGWLRRPVPSRSGRGVLIPA